VAREGVLGLVQVVVSVVHGEFEGYRALQVQRGADIRAVATLY
jgi:hypothetical protein